MKPSALIVPALSLALTLCPMTAQAQPAPSVTATAEAAIDDHGFVGIRGVEQWITLRGADRANPVLLIVGGTATDGPGAVMSPLVAAFQPLEKDFTIVQWDPRGAGKTFARSGLALGQDFTIENLASDGIAVTEHIRKVLPGRRVVVVGINFGSTLGPLMVKRRPDLFAAYVGIGQIANVRAERERFAYERVLRLATAANDQAALDALKVSGPTPFREPRDPQKVAAFLKAGAAYRPPAPTPAATMQQVLSAPGWTPDDLRAAMAGMQASEAALGRSWGEGFDFATISGAFAVPVFIIQGEDNDVAPTPMARTWLDGVTAPVKRFTAIPTAGNHLIETHPAEVLSALKAMIKDAPQAASGGSD